MFRRRRCCPSSCCSQRRIQKGCFMLLLLILAALATPAFVLPFVGPTVRDILHPSLRNCPLSRVEMLPYVATRLEHHGIPYYLHFGTLLGAVRNSHIIPWTGDLDFAIQPLGTNETLWPLVANLLAPCFDIPSPEFGGTIKAAMPKQAWAGERVGPWYMRWWTGPVYIDFYGLSHYGSHYFLHGTGHVSVGTEVVDPLGSVVLEGRSYPAPAKTDAFLKAVYGASWRTPDSSGAFGMGVAEHLAAANK